ncbi:hypothetical protein D3C73_467080 [compost metagenome]
MRSVDRVTAGRADITCGNIGDFGWAITHVVGTVGVKGCIPLQRIVFQAINVGGVVSNIGGISSHLGIRGIQLRAVNGIGTGGRDNPRRHVGHLFTASINTRSSDAWPAGYDQPICGQCTGIGTIGGNHRVNHRVIRHLQLHHAVGINHGVQVGIRVGTRRRFATLDRQGLTELFGDRTGVTGKGQRGVFQRFKLRNVYSIGIGCTGCHICYLTANTSGIITDGYSRSCTDRFRYYIFR